MLKIKAPYTEAITGTTKVKIITRQKVKLDKISKMNKLCDETKKSNFRIINK